MNGPAKLKAMSLADLIGNALDRVGVALRDVQEAERSVGLLKTGRIPDDTARILTRAQELLREAEGQADSLTALRRADQATIASLGLVNKELADALATVLKSAKPHPIHHPTMYAAWAIGEAALRSPGRLPRAGRRVRCLTF